MYYFHKNRNFIPTYIFLNALFFKIYSTIELTQARKLILVLIFLFIYAFYVLAFSVLCGMWNECIAVTITIL